MTNVQKIILVPHGMIKEIAHKLHVHRNTVRFAIYGKTNTPKARVIRAMAEEMQPKNEDYTGPEHVLREPDYSDNYRPGDAKEKPIEKLHHSKKLS